MLCSLETVQNIALDCVKPSIKLGVYLSLMLMRQLTHYATLIIHTKVIEQLQSCCWLWNSNPRPSDFCLLTWVSNPALLSFDLPQLVANTQGYLRAATKTVHMATCCINKILFNASLTALCYHDHV